MGVGEALGLEVVDDGEDPIEGFQRGGGRRGGVDAEGFEVLDLLAPRRAES